MATGLLTGLLGYDPLKAQQERFKMLTAPMMNASNPYEKIGASLGTILGVGLGNVFGSEDPTLQQASKVQSIMGDALKGVSVSDTDSYRTALENMAVRFEEEGMAPQALYAKQEAMKLVKEIDPKKRAAANVLRIESLPENERTEEDKRILAASRSVLGREDTTTVQSSTKYKDGTIVSQMRDGTPRVIDPEGKVLTGEEARKQIEKAVDFEIKTSGAKTTAETRARLIEEASFGPTIAGGKKAGEFSQTIAVDTFKQTGLIRSNIQNLQNARQALLDGAQTGVIAERFPDWKASTLELKNVQQRLGLDIVGATTFGALSKGELDLSLDLALPTKMSPPELINHLDKKIAAQEKLVGYLEQQARFLSIPGRTLNDWLNEVDRIGRERQNTRIRLPSGQELTVDEAEQRLNDLIKKQRGGR